MYRQKESNTILRFRCALQQISLHFCSKVTYAYIQQIRCNALRIEWDFIKHVLNLKTISTTKNEESRLLYSLEFMIVLKYMKDSSGIKLNKWASLHMYWASDPMKIRNIDQKDEGSFLFLQQSYALRQKGTDFKDNLQCNTQQVLKTSDKVWSSKHKPLYLHTEELPGSLNKPCKSVTYCPPHPKLCQHTEAHYICGYNDFIISLL